MTEENFKDVKLDSAGRLNSNSEPSYLHQFGDFFVK